MKSKKEIQPNDIWNKESQDKIKEHILNHANNQSPEDRLETELAAKKYTEQDLLHAFREGVLLPNSQIGIMDDIFKQVVESLNKQE